jgi:hypothetical protein
MGMFSLWEYSFGAGGYLVLLCLSCVVALHLHRTYSTHDPKSAVVIERILVGAAIGFAVVYVLIPVFCFLGSSPGCYKYYM